MLCPSQCIAPCQGKRRYTRGHPNVVSLAGDAPHRGLCRAGAHLGPRSPITWWKTLVPAATQPLVGESIFIPVRGRAARMFGGSAKPHAPPGDVVYQVAVLSCGPGFRWPEQC